MKTPRHAAYGHEAEALKAAAEEFDPEVDWEAPEDDERVMVEVDPVAVAVGVAVAVAAVSE